MAIEKIEILEEKSTSISQEQIKLAQLLLRDLFFKNKNLRGFLSAFRGVLSLESMDFSSEEQNKDAIFEMMVAHIKEYAKTTILPSLSEFNEFFSRHSNPTLKEKFIAVFIESFDQTIRGKSFFCDLIHPSKIFSAEASDIVAGMLINKISEQIVNFAKYFGMDKEPKIMQKMESQAQRWNSYTKNYRSKYHMPRARQEVVPTTRNATTAFTILALFYYADFIDKEIRAILLFALCLAIAQQFKSVFSENNQTVINFFEDLDNIVFIHVIRQDALPESKSVSGPSVRFTLPPPPQDAPFSVLVPLQVEYSPSQDEPNFFSSPPEVKQKIKKRPAFATFWSQSTTATPTPQQIIDLSSWLGLDAHYNPSSLESLQRSTLFPVGGFILEEGSLLTCISPELQSEIDKRPGQITAKFSQVIRKAKIVYDDGIEGIKMLPGMHLVDGARNKLGIYELKIFADDRLLGYRKPVQAHGKTYRVIKFVEYVDDAHTPANLRNGIKRLQKKLDEDVFYLPKHWFKKQNPKF